MLKPEQYKKNQQPLSHDEIKVYLSDSGITYSEIIDPDYKASVGLVLDVYRTISDINDKDFQPWEYINTVDKLAQYVQNSKTQNVRKISYLMCDVDFEYDACFIASRWSHHALKMLVAYFIYTVVYVGIRDLEKAGNDPFILSPMWLKVALCDLLHTVIVSSEDALLQPYECLIVAAVAENPVDTEHVFATKVCHQYNVTQADIIQCFNATREKIDNGEPVSFKVERFNSD